MILNQVADKRLIAYVNHLMRGYKEPLFALQAAVLLQAMTDLTMPHFSTKKVHGLLTETVYYQACIWFLNNSSNWLFSYLSICDNLDIDSVWLRKLLILNKLLTENPNEQLANRLR